MKKIGILTLYYNNFNYGGLLQAYALQQTVSMLGYTAEQISFCRNRKKLYFRKIRGIFEEPVTTDILKIRAHILRKGHDMRYAIDPTKIHNELGWLPETMFRDGIQKTIRWYLENREWWETIISGEYQNYYEKMYGNR